MSYASPLVDNAWEQVRVSFSRERVNSGEHGALIIVATT